MDEPGIAKQSAGARGGDPDGSAGGSPSRGDHRPRGIDDPPPILKRWSRLYWLVGGLLAADVLVSWLLTRWAT